MGKLIILSERLVRIVARVIAIVLVAYGAYALYDTAYTEHIAYGASVDAERFRPDVATDDGKPLRGSELASINGDYRAWIKIDGTPIDHPVMQGADDLYYASHDFRGKASLTGSVYLAAANAPDLSDAYNVLYGHHMDNGALFGALDAYLDDGYLEAHEHGVLVTDKDVFDLRFFAVVTTNAYDRVIYDAGSPDLARLLAHVASLSPVQGDPSVAEGAGKVVALSTCEGGETNGRLVVLAVADRRAGVTVADDAVVRGPSVHDEDASSLVGWMRSTADHWSLVNLACLLGMLYTAVSIVRLGIARGDVPAYAAGAPASAAEGRGRGGRVRATAAGASASAGSAGRGRGGDVRATAAGAPARAGSAGRGRGGRVWATAAGAPARAAEGRGGDVPVSRVARIARLLEVALVVFAVGFFLLTEDVRLPLVMIDDWTPVMLLLFATMLASDCTFARVRYVAR